MKYLHGVPFDESEIEEYRSLKLSFEEKVGMVFLVVALIASGLA